jgi:hypothetical protein
MSFSQGEHTFEDGILISGEEIRGYTAASALVAGEPVAVSGEYEVDAASEAGAFVGVAAYDVAAGEEVAVLSDTCEVRGLLASEAISAGDAVTTAGSGKFRVATGSEDAVALAQTGAGGDGETFQAYLTFVVGNYGGGA